MKVHIAYGEPEGTTFSSFEKEQESRDANQDDMDHLRDLFEEVIQADAEAQAQKTAQLPGSAPPLELL